MTAIRILIVDDDGEFADGLAELIELDGHDVRIVATGAQGVTAAVEEAYDIVLMDIGLPDIDGVECLRRIRALKPGVHALLMTGYSSEQLRANAIEFGALEVMTKPLDIDSLLKRLAAASD
ncbi:MAG: response regulator [Alphaproteobacteria bacterium]|nr:response regulator [Alphaproteobacteria bacterium]MDP6517622.1 response regulator [Alphaproteobacteria bacterium]